MRKKSARWSGRRSRIGTRSRRSTTSSPPSCRRMSGRSCSTRSAWLKREARLEMLDVAGAIEDLTALLKEAAVAHGEDAAITRATRETLGKARVLRDLSAEDERRGGGRMAAVRGAHAADFPFPGGAPGARWRSPNTRSACRKNCRKRSRTEADENEPYRCSRPVHGGLGTQALPAGGSATGRLTACRGCPRNFDRLKDCRCSPDHRLKPVHWPARAALLLSLSAAYAEDKPPAVSGVPGEAGRDRSVAGVKQDAIQQVKPVTQTAAASAASGHRRRRPPRSSQAGDADASATSSADCRGHQAGQRDSSAASAATALRSSPSPKRRLRHRRQ